MEEESWFEGKDDAIVNAPNQSKRHKLIEKLQIDNPSLYNEFIEASNDIAYEVGFVKNSGRYPLTSDGKLDYFQLFAEHCLYSSAEAWGLVIPTGIAVNDGSKKFFSKLVEENRLAFLYSFENEEKIFPIHHSYKFCLLSCGKAITVPRKVSGGFFLRRLDHLLDPARIYTLQTDDFALLNPNTKTCPVFRTAKDAQLTAKIYHRSSILQNETTGDNPWNVRFGSMLNMSTDSGYFHTYKQMVDMGAEMRGNCFVLDDETYIPLYEGKMIWHYNHHYGTWPTTGERPNAIDGPELDELSNPEAYIMPWYWVSQNVVRDKLMRIDNDGNVVWEWKHNWLLGFRDVTNASTERTFIASLIPDADWGVGTPVGVGNSTTLLYEERGAMPAGLLLGMMSSIPFDYTTRQKIGGSHASISFVKQFPVLRPEQFTDEDKLYIIPRVYELAFFNKDLQGWADELWEECDIDIQQHIVERIAASNGTAVPDLEDWQPKPCIYKEERRAVAQAELDAYYAHLYGLTTDELRYILDPEDICGVGCINETFRVLKDNEIRKFGEYRTKRLVMEAWGRMEFDKFK